jgi:tetratricopeptide (TPR) repeat protein
MSVYTQAVVISLLCLGIPALWSQSDSGVPGQDLFIRAMDDFFNEAREAAEIRADLERCRSRFAGIVDPCQRDYWLARTHYLEGIVERGAERLDRAEQQFLESQRLAEAAVGCDSFDDGYRLIADNYAQLMLVNGLLYKITTGRKIKLFADKALAGDPWNPKARLTLALYYLNAPRYAGGDIGLCIEILESLRQAPGLERVDRFSILAWLAVAHAKQGESPSAREYADLAQRIYPGNTWFRDLVEATLEE